MANTLKLSPNGASLLANAFGVGFIDWLGVSAWLEEALDIVKRIDRRRDTKLLARNAW